MIKFENTETVGWEHAIRGMRNPMNSWEKSDTGWVEDSLDENSPSDYFDYNYDWRTAKVIGPNDLDLMTRLRNAGTDHRKFMRMLVVYVDITAPLYWWKEFDTYKVGTVANSCSTMHKIHAKEFTLDDFSHEKLDNEEVVWTDSDIGMYNVLDILGITIETLNCCREKYLKTKDKKWWWQMIQLLPSSYNQKRTVMLNYEVLTNMYHARKTHKLDEWHDLCRWVETLPYAKELILDGNKEQDN